MIIKNLYFRHHVFPVLSALIFILFAASCGGSKNTGCGFSAQEQELLNGADTIMRVLTIENPVDEVVLRAKSSDLSAEALLSDKYEKLARLMIATVTHPSQDGVGIAGPQVGINKRVVAVQRFDKMTEQRLETAPFEVYPNVRIIWTSDSLEVRPEGCLSVPDRRGEVKRSQEIVIEYVNIEELKRILDTNWNERQNSGRDKADEAKTPDRTELPMVRDTVRGFTAVIFQHEVDHLDGILYIDRL
jgi:peptide deformylase